MNPNTKPVYGVAAMSRWNSRLYFGSMFNALSIAALKEVGVTAVCNLTDDDFTKELDGAYPFEYMLLDQHDGEHISSETIERFLDWMDTRWAEGHTIFIHCHAGISRTSSFLIAWLMHCSGCDCNSDLRGEWSSWEDKVGLIRPIIHPHHALKRSILDYFMTRTPERADAIATSDWRADHGRVHVVSD